MITHQSNVQVGRLIRDLALSMLDYMKHKVEKDEKLLPMALIFHKVKDPDSFDLIDIERVDLSYENEVERGEKIEALRMYIDESQAWGCLVALDDTLRVSEPQGQRHKGFYFEGEPLLQEKTPGSLIISLETPMGNWRSLTWFKRTKGKLRFQHHEVLTYSKEGMFSDLLGVSDKDKMRA